MYTKEFKININRKDSDIKNLKKSRHSLSFITMMNLSILILTIIAIIGAMITLTKKVNELEIQKFIEQTSINTAKLSVDNTTVMSDLMRKEEINFETQLGREFIDLDSARLLNYELPNTYYGDHIDFSSFQPYMGYKKITNTSTPAYKLVNDERCYTDELGLRRMKTTNDQFTVDGQDDYVVAMGTFYKEKGTCGTRFLVVTTEGMFTVITGDEKDDRHTDAMNMFTTHAHGKVAIIEWVVDEDNLSSEIKKHGTVTKGGPEVVKGEILYIYEIKE